MTSQAIVEAATYLNVLWSGGATEMNFFLYSFHFEMRKIGILIRKVSVPSTTLRFATEVLVNLV